MKENIDNDEKMMPFRVHEGCPCIFAQGPPSSKLRHCFYCFLGMDLELTISMLKLDLDPLELCPCKSKMKFVDEGTQKSKAKAHTGRHTDTIT